MKLKVCGMKYENNIAAIAGIGPDFLGFIFYDKSPRNFSGTLPFVPESIKKVGVFVDAPLAIVLERIKDYSLEAVQLHGGETSRYCLKLKQAFEKLALQVEIIKVFSVNDDFDFKQLAGFEPVCDFYLFDTKGKLPGGNGVEFDWKLLLEYPSIKPYFLSGGIGLNSLIAIQTFLNSPAAKYCYAIDVNSKFELEPGLKDQDQIKEMKTRISKLTD